MVMMKRDIYCISITDKKTVRLGDYGQFNRQYLTMGDQRYFGKRQSVVKLQLMKTYCTSFYGSVLWDLSHPVITAFCTTWRKGICRIWGIPYCTHISLLPIMSNCLPLLDELCCRSAAFIKSCLKSDSSIVSAVAHYGVYDGRMNSHIGGNAFFCCSRYDVTDI